MVDIEWAEPPVSPGSQERRAALRVYNQDFRRALQSRAFHWALYRPDEQLAYDYAANVARWVRRGDRGWGEGWQATIRGYAGQEFARVYIRWVGEQP